MNNKKKCINIIAYIIVVILAVFYLATLVLGSKLDVSDEYKLYYVDGELSKWPGENGLDYYFGNTEIYDISKLEEYKKSLSKDEIERIVKETAELKKYQSEPSTEEELAKIPLLSREDISKDIVPLYNDEKEVNGVKVIHHNIYTNGILYSTLAFNVNSVKDEDIPYLGLLEAVLGYVSTDKYSYDELSNETDIHTGGIIPSFTFYNNIDNPDVYTAVFGVKFKTLIPELGVAYDLISQMVFHAKYDDYKLSLIHI